MTQKPTLSNPFEELVDMVGEDLVPVTLDLLAKFSSLYLKGGLELKTYSQVFESLRFLEKHGVIELIYEPDLDRYLVKSLYGKINQQS